MAPGKILIVDDSDSIRTALKLTLEFKGHEVAEAEDGHEGLELIRKTDFDLVFCDLGMQGLDGLGLIKKVREDLKKEKLPIIVLSAEERDAKLRALQAGATACVDKPFSPQQILETVARTLGE